MRAAGLQLGVRLAGARVAAIPSASFPPLSEVSTAKVWGGPLPILRVSPAVGWQRLSSDRAVYRRQPATKRREVGIRHGSTLPKEGMQTLLLVQACAVTCACSHSSKHWPWFGQVRLRNGLAGGAGGGWRDTISWFPRMGREPCGMGDVDSRKRLSRMRARGARLQSLRAVADLAAEAPAGPGTPAELPKTFDLSAEERLYKWWEEQGYFKPDEAALGEPFVMTMPPPNVTGALHMGHAMFVTLEDMMARFHRMRGRPVLWLPGTDHAGIATQLKVEQMLAAEGITRAELGREAFVERVFEWKAKYGGEITRQLRRLGASCDWSRERFTLDEGLSRAVAEAFVRLHEKGLVYRGSYLVNWSPNLQTAVSDLEVEYSEEPGRLYFFKYPVAGGTADEFLPVATTRPETVFGDTAVAVHPEDERYKRFVGRKAVVPMSGGREIEIIADTYVDREFGTGALKITPGHDPNDYAIGQRLGLPLLNVMERDGRLNENAGAYAGMDRFDARKKLWADMEAAGIALRAEPYTMRVPRSQRGGEVIEPLLSKQWFVKMQPLADPALEAARSGAIKFVPERFEKVYFSWLENIKDWCVSRQLWWGHQIPVWYVTRGGAQAAEATEEEYVVARNEAEAYEKARQLYGNDVTLRQEEDVLDTWFSSGLWPFSTLGWPDKSSKDLARFYPTQMMETGHDILFFWVARMAMMGIELTGRAPFSTVYLHGLVRDGEGRKMSKSLGNVVDPLTVIQDNGTDALRFTLAVGNTAGQDLNLSMERLGANRALTNKLWNAGKFLIGNLPEGPEREALASHADFASPEFVRALPLSERWIVSRAHKVVDHTTACFERLDFGEAGRAIYEFFWSDFADWYIEASKTRLYKNPDLSAAPRAQRVLVYVLDCVLRLLHPFMPYVTEELWQALPHEGEALIVARWPSEGLPRDAASLEQFADLQALVRSVRNARAEYSVEPARRIVAHVVVAAGKRGFVEEECKVVASLARLDPEQLSISEQAPEDTLSMVHLVISEGLEAYLPLAGMVDVRKEVERLSKQRTKLQADLDAALKRLSLASFVEKAPAAVVQNVRNQATESEEKLAILNSRLDALQRTATAAAK